MLLLKPHNLQVLGGQVQALEEARQRMVAFWQQPAGTRMASVHSWLTLPVSCISSTACGNMQPRPSP